MKVKDVLSVLCDEIIMIVDSDGRMKTNWIHQDILGYSFGYDIYDKEVRCIKATKREDNNNSIAYYIYLE